MSTHLAKSDCTAGAASQAPDLEHQPVISLRETAAVAAPFLLAVLSGLTAVAVFVAVVLALDS